MQAAIRCLTVLIALLALSPHSYAQTDGNQLEGLARVNILVEDLHEDARTCGSGTISLCEMLLGVAVRGNAGRLAELPDSRRKRPRAPQRAADHELFSAGSVRAGDRFGSDPPIDFDLD